MVPGELNKLLWRSQILAMLISLQSLLRHLSSGNSLLLSNILRLTGIAPPTLNPKSLEPQHRATASQRRKPKISRAPHWGAPRRRPPRTCPKTGHQWGTRRKVKRWTTNWLRQKSKNHLALLLLLFLISGGKKQTQRLQNWSKLSSLFLSFPLSGLFLLFFAQSFSMHTSFLSVLSHYLFVQ